MVIIPQINKEIEQAQSILVASHRNPEADALGSSLAICHHFSKGKKIQVFNADEIPYFLTFLPGAQSVIHDLEKISKDFELAVVVDCAALSRVCEAFPEFVKGKRIINIDHHETGKGFGDLKLINPHASSTAEILYQVLSESDRPILKDTATCLYAAISNDTGSFQFRNTSRATLETAACLVKLGANAAEIARGLYESHPKSRILLLAMAFQTIVFSQDSKRADITLTTEMFKSSGATVPMTEGFVNFLTAVKGVEVAILFRQMGPAKFKISLRSQGAINVATLCEKFGGGGHAQAAGATLEGELPAVQELVRKEVDELIAKNNK